MPLHSSHSSRLSTSEPPDGVHLCCLLLAAVGGARPRGGWRSSVIARLQEFSSCSPAAVPRRRSPRTMTASLVVGKSEPGRGLSLGLSFKDVHHPCWGGGCAELGPAFRGQRPASSLSVRGRRAFVVRDAVSCRVSGSPAWAALALLPVPPPTASRSVAARPPHGCRSHNTSYDARAVFVFWDSLVLAPVVRTGVRTCRCALRRPPFAGVVLARKWPLSSVLRWWLP
jgi:hypothetical protein